MKTIVVVLAVAMLLFTTVPAWSQATAAGEPYRDCAAERETAVRLSRGLDGLNDQIARTERQLDDAKIGRRQDAELAKRQAQAQRDFAADVAVVMSKMDEFEAALNAAPLTPAARASAKLALGGIRTSYEGLYKNPKAMTDLSQAEVQTLGQKVAALNRLMVDTGSYKYAGKKLIEGQKELAEAAAERAHEAFKAGEPTLGKAFTALDSAEGYAAAEATLEMGGLVLATGVFAIDTIYARETSFQNELDETKAADTLNTLKQQKSKIMDTITDVVEFCGAQQTQPVQDSPRPIPPEAPAPQPVAKAPAKGGGASAGKTIAILGLAVGGGVVAAESYHLYQQRINGGGGGDNGPPSSATGSLSCAAPNIVNLRVCSGSITIHAGSALSGFSTGTLMGVFTPSQFHGGFNNPGVGGVATANVTLQTGSACPGTQNIVDITNGTTGVTIEEVSASIPVSCK